MSTMPLDKRVFKISKEMDKAVLRSGYLSEQKIDSFLRKEAYLTTPNYTFEKNDGSLGEIDILGEAPQLITKKGELEFISPIMIVEVKNVFPVICFTRKAFANIGSFVGYFQFSGMPKNIWDKKNEGEDVLDFLEIEKFHHYYKKAEISSQFCIISKRLKGHKQDHPYVASHSFGGERNLYQEIILPLVEGLRFVKKNHDDDWYFDPEREPINLKFYYPIAVVRDLFEYNIDSKKPSYKKVHHINFIRMHKSKEVQGDFVKIDICDEEGFKQLIDKINDEMEQIIKIVKKKKTLFRKSALVDAKERYREQQKRK